MKKLLTMVVAAFFGCPLFGALTDGLVAYYEFDGNANDSSGNGNNGAVHGATSIEDRKGNENGAYAFRTASYISVPNSSSLQGVGDWVSVAAWINPTSWYGENSDWIVLLCKGSGSGGRCRNIGFAFHSWGYMEAAQSDLSVNMSKSLRLGEWQHVAYSSDGVTIKVYINGECVGTRQCKCGAMASSDDLLIGCDPVGDVEYFNGAMDDLRIYNRALSATEVKALYEGDGAPKAWYVNGTSGSDGYSGKSSDLAKKTIQAAIDVASSGDTILVAAGTYDPINAVGKTLTIRGVSGASTTIIDGKGAKRCAWLSDEEGHFGPPAESSGAFDSALEGFTLKNGWSALERVSNSDGAGVRGGTVRDCIIEGGHSYAGGGASCAKLFRCIVRDNVSEDDGGGVISCIVYDSLICRNKALNDFGGAAGSAATASMLYNCTLTQNVAYENNCDEVGAIDYYMSAYNCIVWANVTDKGREANISSAWGEYYGDNVNNYVLDPHFVDVANGDYRLAADSPCIDAGDNSYVMGTTDLDGNARMVNGKVDIGCYEFSSAGALENGLVAWYKFDGNANDSSRNGYGLTVIEDCGAPVLVPDRNGNANSAYLFDGTKAQRLGNMDEIQRMNAPRSTFTFALWFQTDASYADYGAGWAWNLGNYAFAPINGDGIDSGLAGLGVKVGCDGIEVVEHSGFYMPTVLSYHETMGTAWNHLAVTIENDGKPILYVNGVKVGEGEKTDRVKCVWADSVGGFDWGYYTGKVDDLRIYNRALSAVEVKALYDGDGTPVVTKCAVTFDAAGGTAELAHGEVEKGAAVGTLPTATREGYEFLGWFTAASGGTQVTAATVVTADVTFYAHWRESSGGGDDSKWKYVISGGRAIVTGVESVSGAIVIPSELGGCPVTGIGEYAFEGCEGMTSVTIPESVTSIGDSVFYGCSGLTSVMIPSNVTDVGAGAFADCEKLMSVEICGGVIGDGEFSECVGLETVVLHEGVTEIGSGAFSGCIGLTSVTTPSSVKSIGEGAFTGCAGLARVVIQGGTVGEGAFAECEGLVTVEIGGGDIGESAFSECRRLETVVLHEGVTAIGNDAFTDCIGLTSVTIPSSVKSIGNGAFNGCSGLTRVVIQGGIIGEGAFYGCEGLTTVEIGTGVASIGCGAFLGSEALSKVVIRGGSIGDDAFQGCQRLTSVELHEGVTGIGEYAFKDCIGLRSIEIPKSVVNIGFEAFHGCIWLDSVVIRGGAVGEAAFEGCHQLRSVVFYEGVTKIGEHAFVEVPGPFYFLGRKPETVGDVFSAEVIPVDPRVIYFKRGVSGWTDGGTWQGLTTYSWDGVIVTCVFDANGGVCSVASKEYVSGSALQILPTATREEYEFLGWFTAADGGTQVTAATAVTADVTYYAQWKWAGDGEPGSNECYKVSFNANGGNMSVPAKTIAKGAAVGELPILARDGYEFLGWFTAADGGMQVTAATVVTADVTFYAQWKAQVPDIAPKEDQPMDAGIANVYDGVITDADGLPIGSVNVKAGKISNSGVSKVTATIQMAGESKKVTIKGEVKVSDAVMTAVAKDGRKLDLMFLRNSISGTFDGCQIEGTRNWLSSSGSSAEKSAAEAVVNRFAGNYTIAYGDEQGWNGLSLAVMKKGKCKISGKLANGKGVATTSQMIIGEDYCCVPVICAKKGVELSLSIYFPNNGKKPFVFGFYNAVIASVSELGSGRTFRMGDGIYDPLDMYEIEDGYLPEGVSVEQRGKKWIVADGVKPGKIKMDREEGVYDANESENPSGLKLTFTAKTGLFKGTFKVYGINDKGKLKSFTATVNGIVVDGCGYGTATVKKFGSVPITIE